MNSTIFKKWFIEIMQNLEESCVIVMNNCPYHSVLVQNYPKSIDNKATYQKWLAENGVEFASFETLSELQERVKLLKPKDKRYELDEIALEMGHEVIRLPPYHCQYNPIELIWAQVKGEIANKNNSFKITYVENLANIAIESVTVDNWKRVDHCERLQEEDFIKEGFRDQILEPIVLTINPDDSSKSKDDDDESLQF
jgi:transposase